MDKNLNSTGPHAEFAEKQIRKYERRAELGLPLFDGEESFMVPTEHVEGVRGHESKYMRRYDT